MHSPGLHLLAPAPMLPWLAAGLSCKADQGTDEHSRTNISSSCRVISQPNHFLNPSPCISNLVAAVCASYKLKRKVTDQVDGEVGRCCGSAIWGQSYYQRHGQRCPAERCCRSRHWLSVITTLCSTQLSCFTPWMWTTAVTSFWYFDNTVLSSRKEAPYLHLATHNNSSECLLCSYQTQNNLQKARGSKHTVQLSPHLRGAGWEKYGCRRQQHTSQCAFPKCCSSPGEKHSVEIPPSSEKMRPRAAGKFFPSPRST